MTMPAAWAQQDPGVWKCCNRPTDQGHAHRCPLLLVLTCPRCQTDGHVCPGCGVPTTHARFVCTDCRKEHR